MTTPTLDQFMTLYNEQILVNKATTLSQDAKQMADELSYSVLESGKTHFKLSLYLRMLGTHQNIDKHGHPYVRLLAAQLVELLHRTRDPDFDTPYRAKPVKNNDEDESKEDDGEKTDSQSSKPDSSSSSKSKQQDLPEEEEQDTKTPDTKKVPTKSPNSPDDVEADTNPNTKSSIYLGAMSVHQEEISKRLVEPFLWTPSLSEMGDFGEVLGNYFLTHSAEIHGCDVLLEVDRLDKIHNFLTEHSFQTSAQYLTYHTKYLPEPIKSQALSVVYNIYMNFKQFTSALLIAMQINDKTMVTRVFNECDDKLTKKQLAFLLGTHCVKHGLDDTLEDSDEDEDDAQEPSQEHIDTATTSQSSESSVKTPKTKSEGESTLNPQDSPVNLADYSAKSLGNNSIVRNQYRATAFKFVSKEMKLLDPLLPEDVYKFSVTGTARPADHDIQSSHLNLASSFANAFINAGFTTDKLLTNTEESWIFKHRNRGLLSAAASLGLVFLWNGEEATDNFDALLHESKPEIRAGALLGIGLLNTHVRHAFDAPLGVLAEYLFGEEESSEEESDEEEEEEKNFSDLERAMATLGLGLSYAGIDHQELIAKLIAQLNDPDCTDRLTKAYTCLSLGLIAVGTGNGEVAQEILQVLLEEQLTHPHGADDEVVDYVSPNEGSEDQASTSNVAHSAHHKPAHKCWTAPSAGYTRFMSLGLGFLYLGQPEKAETITIAVKSTLQPSALRAYAVQTLETCAYYGTGDVLMIQKMLGICGFQPDLMAKKTPEETESDAKSETDASTSQQDSDITDVNSFVQEVAVLGIAGIALDEPIGNSYYIRLFDRLVQFGTLPVKRTIPLALGLLSISAPSIPILERLKRYSNDADQTMAMNAIFAIGLMAAGTKNSRASRVLRNLHETYRSQSDFQFLIRISLGMVHLGKGLLGLKPSHSEHNLVNPVAAAGLLLVLHTFLDVKRNILANHHYLLFGLALAISPRWVATLDENLTPIRTTCRVGNPIPFLKQINKRKRITGFQTFQTPVIVSSDQMAELATEDYVSLTSVLEDIVILKPTTGRKGKSQDSKTKT